jgi:processive 1,2-diacylglycerol beta-glucosyltransferase
VAADRITVSGIPVSAKFQNRLPKAEARRRLGLDPQTPTVLISGGNHGLGRLDAVLEAVRASQHAQAAVVTGGNKELFEELSAKYTGDPRIKVVGFIDNMETYMQAADFMVGKPGGLTTAEALASGLPIVIANPLPGQEMRNTEFLRDKGAAVYAPNAADLRWIVQALLESRDTLAALQRNAEALARPFAADAIVRKIKSLLD